jgi:hypothetical protein
LDGGKAKMSEIQPTTVYTGFSFEWPLPPPSGRLGEEEARRGFAVEDLLEHTPGFYSDESHLVEGRRLEIEDLEFSFPDDDSKIWGKLVVEQSKNTYSHDFSLILEVPSSDDSRGVVDLIWGVDNPREQRVFVALETLDDDGSWRPVNWGESDGFSDWDKKLIDNLLEASLVHEGINHG